MVELTALRVLISTLGLSLIVMMLAGIVLLRQATAGVVEAKREASLNEAGGVYAFMQAQLRNPEERGVAVHESLNRLADLTDAQAAQYRVVIQGPASSLVSAGIRAESVPEDLRRRVETDDGMFITPTTVVFSDPVMLPEPGFAIGASLIGSTGDRYPIYYIFPMTSELQTLRVLQQAVGGGVGARRRVGRHLLPGDGAGAPAGPACQSGGAQVGVGGAGGARRREGHRRLGPSREVDEPDGRPVAAAIP